MHVLFERLSAYNHIVVSEDKCGMRTLQFGRNGARQSVVRIGDADHLELPYTRVIQASLAFVGNPQRILMIGLGGGTIPIFLHKHFPRTIVDVVEVDEHVVEAASRFCGFREETTLRVYVEDGRRFIEECRNLYDIIILDCYGSHGIPYHLTTVEFLKSVLEILTPEGVLVGNVWSKASNALYDSMLQTYLSVFGGIYVVGVPERDSKILLGPKNQRRLPQEELVRYAREVSHRKNFRFDLGKIISHGFWLAEGARSRGRILTDQARR